MKKQKSKTTFEHGLKVSAALARTKHASGVLSDYLAIAAATFETTRDTNECLEMVLGGSQLAELVEAELCSLVREITSARGRTSVADSG